MRGSRDAYILYTLIHMGVQSSVYTIGKKDDDCPLGALLPKRDLDVLSRCRVDTREA